MNQPGITRTSSWARLALLLCLLIGLLAVTGGLAAPRAHAQTTITVSPCDESHLDAAISQANTDNDGDTITFNCGGSADIPLTSTLTISGNMTIDGSGQTVTLDGQNQVQVLSVNSGVNFTLTALTIAHGSSIGGGGLVNQGTVTISNSTFTNNSVPSNAGGGGLYNFGSLSISNSTVANNSGGDGGGLITSGGTVTISNSTFANNPATNGGGALFNTGGTVTISNSTFANNKATNAGGGLDTPSGGTTSISNSTVANNSAGAGGGIVNGGTTSISNSTVANNSTPTGDGGGLVNFGSLSIDGSIVANNSGGNCFEPGGSFSDQGYNLESGTDCGFRGMGDLQNTDPKLDPSGLQNNGGPTQTLALQSSSPAIDWVASGCPSTDQRGDPRPDDASESKCDIGAYESNYPPDNDLGLTNMPANITTNATSPQGATVTYTPPTVVDEDSPLPPVNCTPASGSTFLIGTTTVTCTVTDSDDSNSPVSQTFTVTVKPVLTASGKSVSATEGRAASLVVATGMAYVTGTLTASISWGDGSSSTVTVTPAADGSYSVPGSHTYGEEGSFAITVTVSASGASNATATSSASVADAALTANTPTVVIHKLAVTLSTVFSDADPNGTASDYTATINWGNGSSSTGTISTNSTSFTATGSHTYAKHQTYTVTVTIKDAGGSSTTKTLTIKV